MNLQRVAFSINCVAELENFIVKNIVAKKGASSRRWFQKFSLFSVFVLWLESSPLPPWLGKVSRKYIRVMFKNP